MFNIIFDDSLARYHKYIIQFLDENNIQSVVTICKLINDYHYALKCKDNIKNKEL